MFLVKSVRRFSCGLPCGTSLVSFASAFRDSSPNGSRAIVFIRCSTLVPLVVFESGGASDLPSFPRRLAVLICMVDVILF